VIDARKLRTVQGVDELLAKAATHVGNLYDPLVQPHSRQIGLQQVAVAVVGQHHKTASAALGHMVFAEPIRIA
jgi:hypothetical protein